MQLVNETESAATLVRVTRDEETMAAALVVKSTYEIDGGGRCGLKRRQAAVLTGPTEIEGADFEPETVLNKDGVDLLVVGVAQAPSPGTRMMAVGVAVGPWSQQVLVFGDRAWQRRTLDWTPSDPSTFDTLRVSWANAYGGVARCSGNPVPHPGNPNGKGYVIDVDASIADQALPNIEDPEQLLEYPSQTVEPVGFEPLPSSSMLRVATALDESKLAGVSRSIFNVAHPRHRCAELRGGERCELSGWAGLSAADVFGLPAEEFVVVVTVDKHDYEFWPKIDTVCVFPSTRTLAVTRRATFTYRYARGAARVARLRKLDSRSEIGGVGHVR